jgi:hypothetical protein
MGTDRGDARKSEVLRATWDMFDLDVGLWVKPTSSYKYAAVFERQSAARVIGTWLSPDGGKCVPFG